MGAGEGPGLGGTLTALHVGGVGDMWEFVLAGPPMVQVWAVPDCPPLFCGLRWPSLAFAGPLPALAGLPRPSPAFAGLPRPLLAFRGLRRHSATFADRWMLVPLSACTLQVNTAEPLATSGEVCVSAEAWRLINAHASGHPPKDDDGRGFMIVDDVHAAGTIVSDMALPALRVDRDLAQLMKRYVPATVTPKLEAGIDTHIAELHMVSVLFINCHGTPRADTPHHPHQFLHAACL